MILEPVNKLQKPNIIIKKETSTQEVINGNMKSVENTKRENKYKRINIKAAETTKETFDIKIYFVISLVFLAGILIGTIYFRLLINDTDIKEQILNKIELLDDVENISQKDILNEVLVRNAKMFLTCWIVGVSIIGSPLILFICFYKGFTIAFTIAAIIIKYGFYAGNIFAFKTLYVSNLFLVFALFIMAVSSTKVSVNILKHKKDMRLELIRHSVLSIFGGFLIAISSVIEIFLA